MIHIAIVDDELSFANQLTEMIHKNGKEIGSEFSITHFTDGLEFIIKYNSNFDIVFMDIDMPKMNGLEASRKLRQMDQTIILIFITRLAQFAVNGYEVEAMDYLIKPFHYVDFSHRMKRAVSKVRTNVGELIRISTKEGIKSIQVKEIKYIEVMAHKLIYHTTNGIYQTRGSLTTQENFYKNYGFSRCNNSYLVNLKYVNMVKQNEVEVGQDKLLISRGRKKDFLADISNYMSH